MTIIMITLTFSPLMAADEAKQVVAEGVAAIAGENIDGAREKAIQDALRNALDQGVGMAMNATSILEDDDLMEKIYTNTQGYVSEYKVIKEKKDRSGLYRVKIQAEVQPDLLMNALVKLGLIKPMMDYPRIMILADPGEAISFLSQVAESILTKQFTDKHFDIVDPAKARELHQEAGELLKADTVNNVAARIGLHHHAEIVLVYGVQKGSSQFDGMMEQAAVNLQTRAIVTTTAQVLTTETKQFTGVGQTADQAGRDASRKAAEEVGQTVMQAILSWWADYTANGLPYIVTLKTPPKSDRLVIAFQELAESIPGVVSLSERSSGGGITEMMIKYKGTSSDFKRSLLKKLYTVKELENANTVVSKGRFFVFSLL